MVGTWSERKDLINRKGQISSTTSARRLVKERIIDLQYLLDNWNRVADKYRVLYTRKA